MTTLRVEWLFSILDSHHFDLYDGRDKLGMLIVNTVDRTIRLRAGDDGKVYDHTPYFRSYNAFVRWHKFNS